MITYWEEETNAEQVEKKTKNDLLEKTFQEILELPNEANRVREEPSTYYAQENYKGGLGTLVEECYFGYKANSDSEADLKTSGVEIKVTPFEVRKGGKLAAGERLVLCMISYRQPVEPNFYKSHVWEKAEKILLIHYKRDREIKNKLQYKVNYVTLFTPPSIDLKIIEDDYQKIISKISAGKAEDLSEGDTMYLGACTKGANAEKSTVAQFYPPHTKARKRAFCYKTSYMTYVLNNYVVPRHEKYESIINDESKLKSQTFEDYIQGLINENIGKSDKELCRKYDRPYNNNKSQWINLTYRMLGIKSNKATEFIKSNIVVKAIRIEDNGNMRESSPLPNCSFIELSGQEWEDSDLYDYLETTKFLFVVYKNDNEGYVLKGCKLWNMPVSDINIAQEGWESIRNIIRDGVILKEFETKKGAIIRNNLPKKNDNEVIHIRPHTQKSYYRFEGVSIGENPSDGDILPDGRWMTKQSFWINNSYIIKQISELL